jgi:hypothetical protein
VVTLKILSWEQTNWYEKRGEEANNHGFLIVRRANLCPSLENRRGYVFEYFLMSLSVFHDMNMIQNVSHCCEKLSEKAFMVL